MIEALTQRLWDSSVDGEIFAIVDGARDERIVPWLHTIELEHVCLYEEHVIADELKAVAPYLIRLQPWSRDTAWLLQEGWGRSWFVLCATRAPTDALRRHLRRFLMVKDEQGRQLYFRFYDPRVLRIYLPTCRPMEKSRVFGPISRFWSETPSGRGVQEHTGGGSTDEVGALVIRAAQMTAFEDADYERFIADGVERVALHHPQLFGVMGRAACEALVRDTERLCRRYRISEEEDVLRVISARVEAGAAYGAVLSMPDVQAVLTETALGGHFKAELLEAHLIEARNQHAQH